MIPTLFYINKCQIEGEFKQRVKNEIPISELIKFTVDVADSTQNLKWIKNHEFIVDGQFYDVVKRIKNGSQLELYCVMDKKDEQFLIFKQKLNRLLKQNEIPSSQEDHFFSTIKNWIGPQSVNLECYSFKSKNRYTFYFLSIKEYQISDLSPPPRFIG